MNTLKASLLAISMVNVIYATQIQAELITKDNVDELIQELKKLGTITDVKLFGYHHRAEEYRQQVDRYLGEGDFHYGTTAFPEPGILKPL